MSAWRWVYVKTWSGGLKWMKSELSRIFPKVPMFPENTNQANSFSSELWSFNLSRTYFLPVFLVITV